MTRIFLIILAIATGIGSLIYLSSPATYQTKGWNPLTLFTGKNSPNLQNTLATAKKTVTQEVQSALDTASNAVNAGGSTLQNDIAEGVNKAVDTATQDAKQRIAGVLGITADSSGTANLSICTAVQGTLTYSLQNPFSPPQNFSFTIDWGDGGTSQGTLRAQDAGISTTHAYVKEGTYVNIFRITAGGQSLTLYRKVCIRN